MQAAGLFAGILRTQARSDQYKFISAHARKIVVATAGVPQLLGKTLQQVVAFEVAVEIVNLLEIVEVADHHRECGAGAAAAGELARKMDEQRTRIRQTS